jgi:hypothetical protein
VICGAAGTLAERLPAEFAQVAYVYERCPGAPGIAGIREGANCQLYAYAVLAHFGLHVAPLRSSDLWDDARLHTVADGERPLDIVFYNRSRDAFGAHIGVVVGADAVLHLCAEIGHPVVWPQQAFAQRPAYAVRLGARRVPSGTGEPRYARSPKPRSSSSARPPTEPGLGRTPSWIAAS